MIGTFRSPGNDDRVRALGAKPVALDLLDPRAVRRPILGAEPDAIVHQATALANLRTLKHFDRSFAQTNRLRTEGTDALLAAAREAGVRGSSPRATPARAMRAWAAWSRPRTIPSTPLPCARCARPSPRCATSTRRSPAAGGIVLRYGGFYGAANDVILEPVRKRQFPIVGDGEGVPRSSTSTTPPQRPCSRSSTTGRHLQHRRRRARPGARVAAGARRRARRQAAPPLSPLAGAAVRGRSAGHDADRVPRRLQREGQARARAGRCATPAGGKASRPPTRQPPRRMDGHSLALL